MTTKSSRPWLKRGTATPAALDQRMSSTPTGEISKATLLGSSYRQWSAEHLVKTAWLRDGTSGNRYATLTRLSPCPGGWRRGCCRMIRLLGRIVRVGSIGGAGRAGIALGICLIIFLQGDLMRLIFHGKIKDDLFWSIYFDWCSLNFFLLCGFIHFLHTMYNKNTQQTNYKLN